MDPEKNYSTGYTENNLFSRERLDPTPGYSFTSQNQKNKRKSFFIIIGVTFLIIILIVMFLILKNINHASKNPNDLINFVKIYQYGDQNDKKKANFEKKMELINILSKMNKEQVNFIKDRLGIEHKSESNEKLENDFTNDFINIFDILEIYNFID